MGLLSIFAKKSAAKESAGSQAEEVRVTPTVQARRQPAAEKPPVPQKSEGRSVQGWDVVLPDRAPGVSGREAEPARKAIPPADTRMAPAEGRTGAPEAGGGTAAGSVRAADEKQAVPIEVVGPVVPQEGWWPELKAFALYMASTEVHTYAFSVAANVILSLFPFIVLLLTLAQKVFHSDQMVNVVVELMHNFLPSNQDWIMRNMKIVAHPRNGTRIFSVVMLLVTSTGVFLPLEVALNNVWGVKENRSYLQNQLVSLGLAASVGLLAMGSVALSAGQRTVLAWVFFEHTHNIVFTFLTDSILKFCGAVASVMLFFLIYWILPHRKIPAMAVLPTAVVTGLSWEVAKYLYVLVLPKLDFRSVYGPFEVSVGLMMWAFLSGLLLLAGAHFSATRYSLRVAREAKAEGK